MSVAPFDRVAHFDERSAATADRRAVPRGRSWRVDREQAIKPRSKCDRAA